MQAIGDVIYRGIKNTYVCDPSQAVEEDWTETGIAFEYVDDGIWMTENLNTKYQTADATTTIVAHVMGGGVSSNSIPEPQYTAPANTGASTAQIKQNGLLYNWAAATNQKGGTTTGQENVDNPGVLNESHSLHKERQGICPTSWHLPSDKEWNELEEVFAASTTEYTNSAAQTFTWEASYNTLEMWRPNSVNIFGHGKSMKSPTSLNGTATTGDSKTANNGGFNILLTGIGLSGLTHYYGLYSYMWSASSSGASSARTRTTANSIAGIFHGSNDRLTLYSVRCKKN